MIEEYINRDELMRLLSTLAVVLTALAIAVLFAIIVVPGLRNANKPETPTPMSPVGGVPGWLDPTEFPPARGRVIPPVDPQSLIMPSPQLIARGKTLFGENCAPCHGELGLGDGPASATMNPRPRNFTSPGGWKNGYDLPAMYKTLTDGVPGTSMASFDYFSRRDRMALAHYVQSLGAFPHGTGSPEALAAISKELAAPGETTPNRIPVTMAMARLIGEWSAPPPLAPPAEDHSPAAEILRSVIRDQKRAAQALAASETWRKGPAELAAAIVADAPGNGFSVSSAMLSPAQWEQLYARLVKLERR